MSRNNNPNAGRGGCGRGNNAYLEENQRIPHDMGRDTNAAQAQRSRTADKVVVAKEIAAEVPEPAKICNGHHRLRKKEQSPTACPGQGDQRANRNQAPAQESEG